MAAGNCVPILAQEAIPVNKKRSGKECLCLTR